MNKKFVGKVLAIISVITLTIGSVVMAGVMVPSFTKEEITMKLGSTLKISTLIKLEESKYDELKTSNSSVVSITEDGYLKAVSTGVAELTYSYINSKGEEKETSCYVEVSKDNGTFIQVDGSTTSKINITLEYGDYTTVIKSPTAAIPTYPEVTKDGYVLEGWYKDASYTVKVADNERFNKDITLYAKWITEEEANESTIRHSTLYDDIDNHWAINAIESVTHAGLFNGVSERLFGPEQTMTRAMVITVFGRLDGVEKTGRTTKFVDVPAGAYYEEYVAWGLENKIISGTSENEFSPNKEITREEMAVMMANYIKYKEFSYELKDVEFYDKDSIATWAIESVKILNNLKIMTGSTDGTYNPKKVATRAEIAKIFDNFIDFRYRTWYGA